MVTRTADGSAGDADYATIGQAYARYRRPDPRIAARLAEALGPARTVLNVGAGAGSYEPADREVTPVEPSASMRAQRPAGLAAAVDATAENLPDLRPGPEVHDRFTRELSRDLADGTWDRRHGHLRAQPALDGSLILVTSRP